MNFDMQTILLRALPVLWALTIHEFAHGWMALRCGDDTAQRAGRLTLNPLPHLDLFGTFAFLFIGFGWAKPVPVNPRLYANPKWDDIKVSLAGVAANLLSAVAFAAIFRVAEPALRGAGHGATLLLLQLYIAVEINFVLLFFNLIPIPPLDGSHVLRELLPWRARERYDGVMLPYGHWILLGLVFLGRPVLMALVGVPSAVLTHLLIGV